MFFVSELTELQQPCSVGKLSVALYTKCVCLMEYMSSYCSYFLQIFLIEMDLEVEWALALEEDLPDFDIRWVIP